MNNCNCNDLLPLIFGYIAGRNSANCCNCDNGVMPINNNCGNNNCWWILLLLFACGGCCCNNGCSCNN